MGDAVVASFYSEDKPKSREEARKRWETKVQSWLSQGGPSTGIERIVEDLRSGDHPVPCFHWEIEFPEIFVGRNRAFDAIIGNPPFLGGKKISTEFGDGFRDWIAMQHVGASGNLDLVAHFFRRAFNLLRNGGTFGLIATNTIAQGETRSGGLRWICEHGGAIYAARRRVRWPGTAAVIVSVIHAIRDSCKEATLDAKVVPSITAFLFHKGGNDDPVALADNSRRSFQGSIVLGMGFTFDDGNLRKGASPLVDMKQLIDRNPKNAERILPYIGSDELNSSPTHTPDRFVIDFGEMTKEQASGWPDLLHILREKAKPERRRSKSPEVVAWPWWQFWRTRRELYEAIRGLERVLVIGRHSEYMSLAFLGSKTVFSDALAVFALPGYDAFALLQSRIHEVWAKFVGSSLKDDPRYNPSVCFETFPAPGTGFELLDKSIDVAGRNYYENRAILMVRNNQGLTATYNRFHNPDENDSDIIRLRELHAVMDRAVLDAYGWTDVQTTCKFLLDYEEAEDTDESITGRRKKKPWRYRWPDDVRDEILARLLELNAERAKEQSSIPEPSGQGASRAASGKSHGRRRGSTKAVPSGQGGLFGEESD